MAPALVQQAVLNNGGNGTVTSYAVSLAGVAATNTLLVYAASLPLDHATSPAMSIADNVSGVWSTTTSLQAPTSAPFLATETALFRCASTPGGSVTATITSATAAQSTGVSLWISEWSGVGAVDTVGTARVDGSNPITSPVVTPTVNGDLVLILALAQHTITASPISPWVDVAGGNWFSNPTGLAYQVAAGTTGLSGTWSQTATGEWMVMGACFLATGGAPPANSGFLAFF